MNQAKAGSGSVFRSRLALVRAPVAVACLVALLLSACTGSAPGPGPTQGNGPELNRKLDLNLTIPWSIVFLDDGTAVISERDTKLIKSVRNDRATTVGEVPGVVPGAKAGCWGWRSPRRSPATACSMPTSPLNRTTGFRASGWSRPQTGG
ncbi:glucose/Sorbosone dehydrogenase [Arthrobacter sp. Hiyo8]|nr:glucose/Sorbosone dehydrogenase [Arthrobacter sp. Hiyo8]